MGRDIRFMMDFFCKIIECMICLYFKIFKSIIFHCGVFVNWLEGFLGRDSGANCQNLLLIVN